MGLLRRTRKPAAEVHTDGFRHSSGHADPAALIAEHALPEDRPLDADPPKRPLGPRARLGHDGESHPGAA